MLKKPLIETNPYLKDSNRYPRDLVTSVSSSTAIETRARVSKVASSLPSQPQPLRPVKRGSSK